MLATCHRSDIIDVLYSMHLVKEIIILFNVTLEMVIAHSMNVFSCP